MITTGKMNHRRRVRLHVTTAILAVLFLLPFAAAAQGEVKQVVVEGMGVDVKEARRNAVRAAVVATVGEMVDAETLVKNDELVQEKILTYSNGFVESMKTLSAKTNVTGLVTVRVRANVRRSKLQQKVSSVMRTETVADGESLFAEMLSRQDSIEDADKMFAKVFAGHREDLLLEAGVVLREDGKPAIELEPNTGKVTVSVRLSVNDKAWNAWVADAQKRFAEMSERSEPAETKHSYNEERWNGPELILGDRRFFFKKDYEPTIKKQLEAVPKRQWVRVALVDKAGWTIAAEYMKTDDFRGGSPLFYYVNYKFGYFIKSDSVTRDVVFEGLSLADLKATAKVVCLVGERNELMTTGTDESLAYRKTHPDKVIEIGNVSFRLAQLSPRLSVGTTEVTQALWEAVMGENPSRNKNPQNPVVNVSWDACQEFLKKLNAFPAIQKSGLRFRLPREEEWEFACRAGATGAYCRLVDGTEITEETLGRVAWFNENSGSETHPVSQKEPNAFGLYDMNGNVYEWTSTAGGEDRVSRGGSWFFSARVCESSGWLRYSLSNRRDDFGFRLCASGRAD